MALFNESLEGRFARLVTSLHNMKGPNPMPQVAPEVQHVIEIQDEIDRYNHNYLSGVTRYASGIISITGDATHVGACSFLNPAGSGIICTIERAIVTPGSQITVISSIAGATVAGSSGNSFPLDSRETPTKKSALVNTTSGSTQAGTSGNIIGRTTNGLGFLQSLEDIMVRGVILAPGGLLDFFTGAVTQQLIVMLIHRERAASPAELRAP